MPATLVSPDDADSMEIETPTSSLTLPAYRNRALTSRQERKLLVFLDDLFLQLTRNYKKRSVNISSKCSLPDLIPPPALIFPRS
jgi:hypothetical protein